MKYLFLQKNHEKKSIYNLNEDEELTHYGQSLADIEKLNDVVESDSDNEETGMLSGKSDEAYLCVLKTVALAPFGWWSSKVQDPASSQHCERT